MIVDVSDSNHNSHCTGVSVEVLVLGLHSMCVYMFVHLYLPVCTCGESEKEAKGLDTSLCLLPSRQCLSLNLEVR